MSSPFPPVQRLKSERIQAPAGWQVNLAHTTATTEVSFGSRGAALDFIGMASDLVGEQELAAAFLLVREDTVRVTVRPSTGLTLSARDVSGMEAVARTAGAWVSP